MVLKIAVRAISLSVILLSRCYTNPQKKKRRRVQFLEVYLLIIQLEATLIDTTNLCSFLSPIDTTRFQVYVALVQVKNQPVRRTMPIFFIINQIKNQN